MADGKQFVVFGLGTFGKSVALTLSGMGFDVLGVDSDDDVVQSLADDLTYVVTTDVMDENALRELGIGNFDAAVISVTDLGASLMCTLLCREMGVRRIIVKARDERHGLMAERLGATEVIYPEKDMGKRVARDLASDNILDYIELGDDMSLINVRVPPSVVGKSLVESKFRQTYEINVVAIRRGGVLTMNPRPDVVMSSSDELIVIGSAMAIKKFGDLLIAEPDGSKKK